MSGGDMVEPMSEHERDIKVKHYQHWLDEQERERREESEVRARLADAERRLDELERRLFALDGPPIQGAGQ